MANVRSTSMAQILSVLAVTPGMSSSAIQRATGISSAALFPALAALEYDALIVAVWEDAAPPRRRIYNLTLAGREKVGAMAPEPAAAPAGFGNWLWRKFVAPIFGG